MAFIRYLLFSSFVFLTVIVSAQNNDKIDKKLTKLYQKGKITKCEKKALKFKKKNPGAASTYLYLSKVEVYTYKQFPNPPHKKQFTHIRKAANYSKKVKDTYPEWHLEVKEIFTEYISDLKNTSTEVNYIKKVKLAYNKCFEVNITTTNPSSDFEKPELEVPELSINLKRKKIIEIGTDLVGLPYKYAGTSPETGFDCSGFTQYLYKQVGIDIPHNSHMQSQLDGKTITLAEALPGDLIIFGKGNTKKWRTQHTGIIYENNNGIIKVVHSVSRGVCIDGDNPSWNSYWKERVLFVKRVPGLD